jgi:hypothetical protein
MNRTDIPFSENVVQSFIFNNEYEPLDISVHGYLYKLTHDILTFKMCEKLLELWISQRVEWHIERGLKL